MDIKRVILFGALAFVIFSLWSNWQIEHPPVKVNAYSGTSVLDNSDTTNMLPNMQAQQESNSNSTVNGLPASSDSSNEKILVKTDVLSIVIDKSQGNIVGADLLKYPESTKDQDKPFTLLQDTSYDKYLANSSLFTVTNQQVKNLDIEFSSQRDQYTLAADKDKLVVNLQTELNDGLLINKTYTFTRGSYLIDMQYTINNQGTKPWTGYMNTQIFRSSPKEKKASMMQMGSFTGASYSIPGESRYKKLSFKDMRKNDLDSEANGGWIAMQQHYFLTAWIPSPDAKNRFYTRFMAKDYTIGNVSQALTIQPDQSKSIGSQLYLGPEITNTLKEISPGLDLTVDYGWLWFISQLLFSVMKTIYNFVGNWGVAIILVTLLIKLAFYRLSAKSYKSMAGMRKLQPKLQSLRERYGDDKAKMSQATMELYRKEKVNPLGGCLPILIQIPVFIALYWVLVESVELRQAHFIFWINDLSAPDRYHVLPIIMGLTMLVQQKLNPAPPDPMQAKVMMFLPVVFTILFLNFPSGLVLYWTVNNSLSILQQWYITRKYGDGPSPKKLASAK